MPLDTTVKIFDSTQAGAPVLNNTAGSLIAVIEACGVNGFGLKACDSVTIAGGVGTANISTGHSAIEDGVMLFAGATSGYIALNGERKVLSAGTASFTFDASGLPDGTVTGAVTVKVAPAGWLKAFAGTNSAAFKSGNVAASGAFLQVVDSTDVAVVRGFETMSDVSTGTGMFPPVSQVAASYWVKNYGAAAARPWWVIANDRFIYIGIASHSGYPGAFHVFAFGDVVSRKAGDAYRAALYAAQSSNTTPSFQLNPVTNNARTIGFGVVARQPSALGGSNFIWSNWFASNGAGDHSGWGGVDYGGLMFPNPADNGIIVTPMMQIEAVGGSWSLRGELPGVFATPQNIKTGIPDGTRIKNIPGMDRALICKHWAYSETERGCIFFDLTGPWSA